MVVQDDGAVVNRCASSDRHVGDPDRGVRGECRETKFNLRECTGPFYACWLLDATSAAAEPA